MNIIKLSYLITTKNKLPYLKTRMDILLSQKSDDEEILIADGASTDGTVEYLKKLKQAGAIQYFISEHDYGEAHALNKLILVARGSLIKGITDDDVIYYPAIAACKTFMLEHLNIDIIGSEGGSFHKTFAAISEKDPLQLVRALNYTEAYHTHQRNQTPFSFCGLGVMLRCASLPVLGLWNTAFRAADTEFSFRTTAGPANIAWYTGYSFVNISNPQSVSLVYMKKIKNETDRLNKFYLNKNPDSFIVEKLKVLKNKLAQDSFFKKRVSPENFQTNWLKLSEISEKWLEKMNESKNPEFIYNK